MRIGYQFRPGVWAAVLAAATFALSGCDRRPQSGGAATRPAGKPVIVASIFPLADLTHQLVDDWATVHTFLPPGASEHATEVTPEQALKLAGADVLVVVGMNLDRAVEDAARRVGKPGLNVVRFADLVDAADAAGGATRPAGDAAVDHDHHDGHDHAHGDADDHGHDHRGPNPHLWLDPVLTMRFVEGLADRLAPLLPADKQQSLQRRAQMVRMNLVMLDQDYRGKLSRVPEKRLITFHNAFDLLAQRYGLEVVAHMTEIETTPGGEVTPGRMEEVADAIGRYRLHVLYAEPQLPDRTVKAIAQQAGVRVLRLDPLGHPNVEGYKDYFQMMRSNLDTLIDGQWNNGDPGRADKGSEDKT